MLLHLLPPLNRNVVGTPRSAAAPAISREGERVGRSEHVMVLPVHNRADVIVRTGANRHRMAHVVDVLQQILLLFLRQDGGDSLRGSFSGFLDHSIQRVFLVRSLQKRVGIRASASVAMEKLKGTSSVMMERTRMERKEVDVRRSANSAVMMKGKCS